MNGLNWLGAG